MVNKRGVNGYGDKPNIPDDELRDFLTSLAKQPLTVQDKLERLRLSKYQLDIGRSTFFKLQKRLGIPSIQKPGITLQEAEAAVVREVSNDTHQLKGPVAIKTILQRQGVLVSRYEIRAIMQRIAPEGFDQRFPGGLKHKIPRKPLTSAGPFREVSADGHEKLNAQALQMGGLSIPIYAYRDKWSGTVLKLCAVPDSRRSAVIGHFFLDFVHQWGGIPVQLTTDKGSEICWQTAIQSIFREYYAPDLDQDVFPPSVALPSTRNTIIEGLWRWLREKCGRNVKDFILRGKTEHRFYAQSQVHHELFYWIFVPLIQSDLDKFTDYWNNHRVRKQSNKAMPSSHIPLDALHHPSLYNTRSCLIEVPEDAQVKMREVLSEDVGNRESHLSWYSPEFDAGASATYEAIGRPPISFDTAWEVFTAMAEVMGN